MQNGQTEQKQGFSLVSLARRRTKVRRVAKFVRSIKHKNQHQFPFFERFKGFRQVYDLSEPLVIYIVLCGLRFFYILFRNKI